MTSLPSPQLTPEVIMAQIKRRYVKVPTARNMLTVEPIAAPTATWIEEKDLDGKVNFISGKGGFKKIYQNFQKKSISTVPYGVQFDVTRDEFNFQQYVTVDDKITSAINEFNSFENDYIWNSILSNPDIPTLNVAASWSDETAAKPLKPEITKFPKVFGVCPQIFRWSRGHDIPKMNRIRRFCFKP